ncbi:unnamed protein product, partial [Symbiodinium microadriaticum]
MVRSLLLEFCSCAYPGLVDWIASNVSFPNSMVDRITPAPSAAETAYVAEVLQSSDAVPVTCESYRQWVIEMVQTVKPYEKVKVRLLNAGHSALGYAGYLAGFSRIDEAASDDAFRTYLLTFFREVALTLQPPEGMDISAYQQSLLQRFANPAIEDQILRICKDGSAKIPGFILPTLRELLESSSPCPCVSFVVAAYMAFVVKCGDGTEPLDDPERMKLEVLGRSCNGGEGAAATFLGEKSLFGDLAENAAL